TALLSSLEGYRGQPRLRPPFPAVEGLYASPTLINNVETLSNVPHILVNGPEWFRGFGPEKSPGTKLFSVSGKVERPGNYEAPMGTPARVVIEEMAGGVLDGKGLKAWTSGWTSRASRRPDPCSERERSWCATRPTAWSRSLVGCSSSTHTSPAASARPAVRA